MSEGGTDTAASGGTRGRGGPVVTFVVARAENGVIGRDGQLPWKLSGDLKHFRRATMGKPIVMGRATWASIGRPLDGRRNIVMSRDPSFVAEGAEVFHRVESVLNACADVEEICVIGGAQIYALWEDEARRVVLTEVHGAPEGDVTMPVFSDDAWREVSRERMPRGERDDYEWSVVELERREP